MIEKQIAISGDLVVRNLNGKDITAEELDRFMDDVIGLVENNGWDCTGSGFKLQEYGSIE